MKRMMNFNGVECFSFGAENKLRIFPPNSYKFKPKDHNIILDDMQECILDNFWYQYNNRREDKGYILSILNSLAEYFNKLNDLKPTPDIPEVIDQKTIYVIFEGQKPGVYIKFEEVVAQKLDAKLSGGISWKKYINIDEALNQARKILGVNYYIEPEAKEYIQKFKRINKNIASASYSKNVKEEETSKYQTYKECLVKGIDPLDGSYIDQKIEEKFEDIEKSWKKEIKEDILKDLRKEIDAKFEEIKKSYEDRYDISLSDDDIMDIAGQGQK